MDEFERTLPEAQEAFIHLGVTLYNLAARAGHMHTLLIGVTHDSDIYNRLIKNDPTASARFDDLKLRPLEPHEMRLISVPGFRILGIQVDDGSIRRLHYHSCGITRTLHSLCYECAMEALREPASERRLFGTVNKSIEKLTSENAIATNLSKVKTKIQSHFGANSYNAFQVAVAAAVDPRHFIDPDNVSHFLQQAELEVIDLHDILNELCVAGILDRNFIGQSESFRFSSDDWRVSLRFQISAANMQVLVGSGDYQTLWTELLGRDRI